MEQRPGSTELIFPYGDPRLGRYRVTLGNVSGIKTHVYDGDVFHRACVFPMNAFAPFRRTRNGERLASQLLC
jgi:hypothetical protein